MNEIAEQVWRLRRARGFEGKLFQGEFHLAHITAVQRMMSSAERGFYKALNTLREFQKQRGFVPQTPDEVGARHASSANGFVPQNPSPAPDPSTLGRADRAGLIGFPHESTAGKGYR